MTKLNVETIPLGPIETNCYLIWPEGQADCWIIDPGGAPGPIIKRIDAQKLRPQMLIVTHGHWDHFIGNRALKDKYPTLDIAIHEADAAVLTDADANLSLALVGKSIESPPAGVLLHDADTLHLGALAFTVLHTPGHAPGAVCLYCANSDPKVVFVGDLIFAGGGYGRTDFPGCSHKQLTASIARLFKTLPDETVVYSGHGPATTIGDERPYF